MLSNTEKARELAKVLKAISSEPRTAKRIAKDCGCTKPTAYSRLEALRQAGFVIDEVKVREGATGPESTAYKLRCTPPAPPPTPPMSLTAVARTRAKDRRANLHAIA